MKPDVCIYHSNCADGFGAAYAVWKRWGGAVAFIPGIYGAEPPDVAGKNVLLVDFSYKRPVLETMAKSAHSVIILDHHKTAEADLAEFASAPFDSPGPDYEIACGEKIAARFDMSKSGAVLAWEFCHPGAPVPTLLRYVQDRDLWRFEMPHSREIAAWIFSYPYRFVTWEEMDRQIGSAAYFQGIVDQGAAIERKHHKDIDELLRQTERRMIIGGVNIPVANLPYTMASDAANMLAAKAPFAACYFDRADGVRIFSLRSRGKEGADVSEIARSYGGGGHKNAAGFQAPAGWEGDALA